VVTAALSLAVLLVAGMRPRGVVVGLVLVMLATVGRDLVADADHLGPKLGLAFLGGWAVLAIVLLPVLETFDSTPWGSFVAGRSDRLDPAPAAALVAALLSVTASANVVVRMVLDVARVDQVQGGSADAGGIRGGWLIGPLERLLIVGFVLAGQPEGVALLVAAKSLLRYPELNADAREVEVRVGEPRQAQRRLHESTEYVILGSLTSWSYALVVPWLAGLA
jgi:hypothetical protein